MNRPEYLLQYERLSNAVFLMEKVRRDVDDTRLALEVGSAIASANEAIIRIRAEHKYHLHVIKRDKIIEG